MAADSTRNFLQKLAKHIEQEDLGSTRKSPILTEEWVTSGIPELDWSLKTLGFKKGVIEIAGSSMAGKTTLGLTVVGNYQAKYPNAICIFMLSEQRIDDSYAQRLGVQFDRLMKIRREHLEDLFYELQNQITKIEKLWREAGLTGKPKIIILWDSISATISTAEMETFKNNAKTYEKLKSKGGTIEENEDDDEDMVASKNKLKHAKMAAFAKNSRDFVKAILAQLYDKDILFICLNHLTDNLNSPHGGKTSTGGTWREFFCYIRLEMTKDVMTLAKHRFSDIQFGQNTKVKVIKNDFGGYTPISLQLCLGYGFTLTDNDIDFAVKRKIIEKKGEKGYSYMNGKLTWNSKRSFYELYRSENKMLKVLHAQIIKARHKDLIESIQNEEE